MMRKILVSLLLLVSGYAMAQPANYIPYASRNRYIALMADSTFHIPRFNGAPSLRTGGSTNDGALAADTANGRLYMYYNSAWSLINKDTSNTFLNSLYKKTGTDSVFEIRGGTHTFAFTVGGSGSGGGITSLGTSDYGLITQNDSTYKVDTALLSTKLWRQKGIDSVQGNVNLKLNITDTANIKPRLYAGSNITITGTYPNLTIASSGGGATPAGNYGNVQLNRNGDLATPASDSLNFSGGLAIKGTLSATALPTGGVDADSLVVITSAGAFKKRNSSAFLTGSGTSAQIAYWSGTSSLTGHARYTVGTTAPWLRIGSTASNSYLEMINASGTYSYLTQGSGPMDITGSTTYNKVRVLSSLTGSTVAEFYRNTTYNRIDLHGAVSCDDLTVLSNFQGAYHIARTVPYLVSGNNYHGFTDGTDFRQGNSAFNSFGTFVTIGNNRTDLDHYAGFQTVWAKDSTNRLGKVYDFVSAVSEMRAGTIDTVYRFKVFEMTKTGGTIVKQYGIHIPALTAATTNVGAYIEDNVGLGTDQPTAKLDINSDKFRVRTSKTPSSASDTGNAGDICWDANYIYICTATNTWKRVAIATW